MLRVSAGLHSGELDAIEPPAAMSAGLGDAGLAGADPFTCAAAVPFWPNASKSP